RGRIHAESVMDESAALFAPISRWVRSRPYKELLLVDGWIHGHIEEADHHLGPRLFTPGDSGIGVGIMRITFGVIECRYGLQHRAGLQLHGLRQAITELPIEIVVRDTQ